ncbi:hypothetical protein MasN3_14180 [Massilia varians]|uniref:Uncharacterized protein n=1 Tax=Massilia varians TaxID=457921 RepID=A0ABM8C440_9BURK|nr:hypothetical protein MasN3_14180 [Massilia varians]
MVGGIAIGALMHGLPLGEAFKVYALLTIGDGLVAQIPALLLSAAAAILVTRIGESGDLEKQVGSQMLAQPAVLFSVAGVMIVLGLVPGMPMFTFFIFAAVVGFVGWKLTRRVQAPDNLGVAAIEAALRDERAPELDWQALPVVQQVGGGGGLQAGRHDRQGPGRAAHQAHQGPAPEPVGADGHGAARDRRARRPGAASFPVCDQPVGHRGGRSRSDGRIT